MAMNTAHQGPSPGPPADGPGGDAIGPDEPGATPGGRAARQTSALLQVGVVGAIVVYLWQFGPGFLGTSKIGRASCRERGWVSVGAGWVTTRRGRPGEGGWGGRTN